MFNQKISKIRALFLCGALLLSAPSTAQENVISETYKAVHHMVTSAVITSYFAVVDANKLSANMRDWSIDQLTMINIVWRTLLFASINYIEQSYLPDRPHLTQSTRLRLLWLTSLAATSASMISYNTRYQEVIVDRYNELRNYFDTLPSTVAHLLASSCLFARNIAYFYTIPLLLKPVNAWYNSKVPNQQHLANQVFSTTKSTLLAHVAFSTSAWLFQHGLISIKNTMWQFLPMAQNLRIFRFDDCSACYLGTNLFGRNGLVRWALGQTQEPNGLVFSAAQNWMVPQQALNSTKPEL